MVQKETLDFLKGLAAHNNREWFQKHRPQYLEARLNILHLVMYLTGEISGFDHSLRNVEPEECLFRINRDTRFSHDKRPYKTNFGAFIKGGGKKTPGAGYYIHVEPGNCFLSGGIYMPPAPFLRAVRTAIADNPAEFRKILNAPRFKREFGTLADETLKTSPRGFARDHPASDLIKYKHYYVMKQFTDREVMLTEFPRRCVRLCSLLTPFLRFLNGPLNR